MCKPCVGAKVVLRFQALIAHSFLDRSITFLYHISACTSGSICRKRISFISGFGVIVSHFVRGDIFFDSPCMDKSRLEKGGLGMGGQRYNDFIERYGCCWEWREGWEWEGKCIQIGRYNRGQIYDGEGIDGWEGWEWEGKDILI